MRRAPWLVGISALLIVVAAACGAKSTTRTSAGNGPPVEVSIRLDRTVVAAGTPIHGKALLDNTTTRTITVHACPAQLFISVGLGKTTKFFGYAPLTGMCRTTHLAPGVNRFPIRVSTMATSCVKSVNQATPMTPVCTPSGAQPALSAGSYRALSHVSALPTGSRQAAPVRVTLRSPPS